MIIWAIADLHLSFGVPNKSMEIFGAKWKGWTTKVKDNWERLVKDEDLVLLAGDLSWASTPEQVAPDLKWIDDMPGTKVIIKGNHDYWWQSSKQLQTLLPPSIHFIHNNALYWNKVAIGGTRLWDSLEYNFDAYSSSIPSKQTQQTALYFDPQKQEKIFSREEHRLKLSLDQLNTNAILRIAMTHYPPISATLEDSRVSKMLESYQIDHCIFGHLHEITPSPPFFGKKNGVTYHLTSCDFLNFSPLKIASI